MAAIAGKVAAITGASAGIGAEAALALAAQGVKLILGARRMDKLEAVAAACRAKGVEALAVQCDVAQRADVDHLAAAAVEKFGRLDVMIANAGFGFRASVNDTTEAQFDEIMATNVKGTWYAMQAAAAIMLKQEPRGTGKSRRGHIIAVSSGAGRRGLPMFGAYSMTKAAQLSLCEAMRVELAPQGVYVSSVHPLQTATEFFDVASARSRVKTGGMGYRQSAEVVGRKIARLIARPKPELWPVMGSAWLLGLAAVLPRVGDWAMKRSLGQRGR